MPQKQTIDRERGRAQGELRRDRLRQVRRPNGSELDPQGTTPPSHPLKLRTRLKSAEETLAAIRSNEVDAVVVEGRRGEQIVTLKGGEPAYRALVEAMSEGAATLSIDGTLLYSNRQFAQLISMPVRRTSRIPLQSLIGEAERDRLHSLLAAARRGVAKGEFNLRSNDGRLIPVHLSLNRIHGYAGQVLGMVVTDLTEARRKHAEWTRLQLAAVVESSQDAVIGIMLDSKIVSWNRGAEEIFGYSAAEVVGKSSSVLIPPGREGELPVILGHLRRGEALEHYETKRMRKDGTIIDIAVTVSPIKTVDGEILGASSVARNITARKQTEVIKQAEDVRRRFLQHVLSAQEEERRRIARELHDEAGQLLTSLLVGLRTLEDCKNINDAKAKGRRLRKITALAIDEVGRLARGLHPTVLEDHGLAIALRRYIAEYSKIHDLEVNLALSQQQCKDLPQIIQVGVYRILQEALTNISRHAQAKTVRIRFTRFATALQVVVIDDGRGFDVSAAASSTSNGLGLQTMRERAAMLRGTVQFQTLSKGTQILLNIPLTAQSLEPANPETN
jgi:PAS domain S-box-containing protein